MRIIIQDFFFSHSRGQQVKNGSTEKSLISRKAAKAQRKISWFRQGKVDETTPFSLSSLSLLLISTFFHGSQE